MPTNLMMMHCEPTVDSSGYVDYSNLRQNPLKLNTFIDFLAKVSPENYPEHPQLKMIKRPIGSMLIML